MELEFKLVTKSEKSRTYYFPKIDEDCEATFTIFNVDKVAFTEHGTHRLETTDGKKFIVPHGWIGLEIEADEWSF